MDMPCNDLKSLKIRFITESDFISDAIRLVTFSRISHTEIATETGTWIGAHASGGVQERPADYCKPSIELAYILPVADSTYAKVLGFARSKIGTSYNFEDIAGLFVHHDISEHGHYICSMFVLEALMAGGLYPLNVLPGFTNLVTPETLHLSPLFRGRKVSA